MSQIRCVEKKLLRNMTNVCINVVQVMEFLESMFALIKPYNKQIRLRQMLIGMLYLAFSKIHKLYGHIIFFSLLYLKYVLNSSTELH